MKFLEIEKEKYIEFFKWVLDKEKIELIEEVDLLLASTYNEPYIYYTKEIQEFFNTQPMKRIAQINQLGTSINFNDNAYHTRLEHCKGAYKNALDFWILKCEDLDYRSKVDKNPQMKNLILADIMEMARHDDCHTMLSHALEGLICNGKANHEDIGKRILLESEEYNKTLNNIRPGLYETMCDNAINDKSAYKLLREGNADFDRMDYIMRDLLYLGLPYERELIEDLLRNCNIKETKIDGKVEEVPVYTNEGFENIQEFLLTRENGYEHEYSSEDRKVLDSAVKCLCMEVAYNEEIPSPFIRNAVKNYMQDNIEDININEFLKTNDIRFFTEVLNIAMYSKDENLKELARLCLPSTTALLQLGVEMLDTKEKGKQLDKYEYYELDYIDKLKELRTENKDLKDLLECEKKRELFTSTSFNNKKELEEYIEKMKKLLNVEDLNNLGVITWDKSIKVYKSSEPIYAENKNGEIYTFDEHPDLTINIKPKPIVGMAVIPSVMRIAGFTKETINAAKELVLQNKNARPKDNTLKYSKNRMSKFRVEDTPYLIGFEDR